MSSSKQKSGTEMDRASSRAREVLKSYGASSERWPEAERASLLKSVEGDSALEAERTDEEVFDRILAALAAPEWPAALANRVLDDFNRRARPFSSKLRAVAERLGHAVWPGVPVWRPVTAVALSIVFGLTVGALLAADQPARDTDVTVASSPLDASASVDSIELI